MLQRNENKSPNNLCKKQNSYIWRVKEELWQEVHGAIYECSAESNAKVDITLLIDIVIIIVNFCRATLSQYKGYHKRCIRTNVEPNSRILYENFRCTLLCHFCFELINHLHWKRKIIIEKESSGKTNWWHRRNSTHLNFLKEDSRVGINVYTNLSFVMEAILSSTFEVKKCCSINKILELRMSTNKNSYAIFFYFLFFFLD